MGQGLSCGSGTAQDPGLFAAVQRGDLEAVQEALNTDSAVANHSTVHDRNSLLHIAAATGQIEILSLLLDRSVNVDVLNRHKRTPLMLAAMHGKLSCLEKLIEAGANILMFDGLRGRTCLHYAACYGHSDCLLAILAAARSSEVSTSWGFSRFVNIRDRKGATPLHLAAGRKRAQCVHILLDNGALVCASTGGRATFSNNSPLHLAARSGSLDCVRELLAWGADRCQTDASGRIPYVIALRHHHRACAALLNPLSAEPLVWPSPLKFMSELNQEAKALLEQALMEANKERERAIFKGTIDHSPLSPFDSGNSDHLSEASDADVCGICFDRACTIEVGDCGHEMCAPCTLALCCHNKPNPATSCASTLLCPFCRSNIVKLMAVKVTTENNGDGDLSRTSSKPHKSWRSRNPSEGSSSFRLLPAPLGRMGRSSGRIAADADDELPGKPTSVELY